MRVYTVVAVWGNTKYNHAGMYYLSKKLKESFGDDFKIIPTPTKGSRFLYPLYRLYNILIALWLYCVVKKDDIVFLMEYLLSETEQSDIANILKKKCDVRGLAHLIPDRIDKEYSSSKLIKKLNYLSRIYVLGSSLKYYFQKKGIPESKIHVTFHYVDNIYYHPKIYFKRELTAICMGNMERDYEFLFNIISAHPEITFILCKGNASLPEKYKSLSNVKIFGFIPESKLLELMQKSDISLNVMKDTVGSNVITTSLACGLVVVASNVGSISNYISDKVNGYLFNNLDECSNILSLLESSQEKLSECKVKASDRAKELSINNFISWFKSEFYGN